MRASLARRAPVGAALAAVAVAALAATQPAAGATRVARDAEGRAIRFDIRTSGVDLAGYARIMRSAVHGDEIDDVTIRVVAPGRVAAICGDRQAKACYASPEETRGRGVIVVPGRSPSAVRATLLHEYGHHVDHSRANGGREEPNGTPRWWSARRMGERLRAGQVAYDYSLGRDRAIGEIFAEDYVQLHMRTSHSIRWLPRPGTSVLNALRRDLGSAPAATPPADDPAPDPGTGTDPGTDPGIDPGAEDPGAGGWPGSGPTAPGADNTLRLGGGGFVGPGAPVVIPFGLLGPGRTARLEVVAVGEAGGGMRVRASLVCDGATVAVTEGGEDGGVVTVAAPGLGPAQCTAEVASAAGDVGRVMAELTLTRPAG